MSQEQDQNKAAWSLYWAQDRLHSCVAQEPGLDQSVLNEVWATFAKLLATDARVLDLATGNGAVASAMLGVKPDLQIDAVDKAVIDPSTHLAHSDTLNSVRFHSETDILDLPFSESSFDALTSQFGIEYAGLTDATLAALPLLKSGGLFYFIVHHADSDLIAASRVKVTELSQLTKTDGLLDTLIKVLRGDANFSQLEELGQAYLEQDTLRTQAISGQVFAGIEKIAASLVHRPKEAIELGAAMNLRVRSELSRLQQLLQAGQSEAELLEWSKRLHAETDAIAEFKPLYVEQESKQYLLAWKVYGKRA